MKADPEELVDEIADDFITYLQRGVNYESYASDIDPNLHINDLEKLLRIHFVLTEGSGSSVGVLDFVSKLRERVRRMKTTASKRSQIFEGEIRGRIDWSGTIKNRGRSTYQDQTTFVCQQTRKNFEIPENLVLKELLSLIHEIVTEDLKPAIDHKSGYRWIKSWVTNEGELVKILKDVFLRNVYLTRIENQDTRVTDRMISSVKKSRTALYRDAATLLERYRKLMDYEIDESKAKDLLKNTFIAPEKTEVLFEFYWLFQVLNSFNQVTFNLIEGGNNAVAEWEDDLYRYSIYHDSTGNLSFQENLEDIELPNRDGYLLRQAKVVKKWQEIAEEAFQLSGTDCLWGGRPDILLEKYEKVETAQDKLQQLFIGEVKYTEDVNYAAQGLRELLEYMAYVKNEAGYFAGRFRPFNQPKISGALFTDRLEGDVTGYGDGNVAIEEFGGTFRLPENWG